MNNKFSFDVYKRYCGTPSNIFYSPYSILSVLGMAYEGAEGQTAAEIEKVLYLSHDRSISRNEFSAANQRINGSDKPYQLSMANTLWVQKDYAFLAEYIDAIKKYYGGNVTHLDFVNSAETSRLTINSYIENATKGKIKDLVPSQSITSLTRLVLTNAVYFNAPWAFPFEASKTSKENFYISPSNPIKASMMHLVSYHGEMFNYAETDSVQVLELPYVGDDLSMMILLPKANNLPKIEASLTAEYILNLRKIFSTQRVDLKLPKFKFESQYLMSEDLISMGMPTAFTQGKDLGGEADFSGMTGKKELNITQLIHKASIDVAEEGSEAAAASTVVKFGSVNASVKVFNANHPFIFLIKDNQTDNILFLGRVINPVEL